MDNVRQPSAIGHRQSIADLGAITGSQTDAGALTHARTAFYVPTLAGGGAEQSLLRLAEAFAARGHAVDLLVNRRTGAYADRVPAGIRVVELMRYRKLRGRLDALRAYPVDAAVLLRPVLAARTPIMTLRYLPGLVTYLSRVQPRVLVSAMFYANLLAVWARRIAGVATRVIVTEHNTLSRRIGEGRRRRAERARWVFLPRLIGRVYPRADAIVAVSDGVADDVATTAGIDRASVRTIYNPVVFAALGARAGADLDHPWFAADAPPVLLAAGRLEAQKNFATLLAAFADLRQQRAVRLLILGEGSLRAALRQQADRLDIGADVSLPGWVDNPYAYMSRAAAFVLSSDWEGLGNVLIEAMACGCPVLATDCPSGPREILADGRYGRLVAVGDVAELARAMSATLDAAPERARLRSRAQDFSVARSADRYRELMDEIVAGRR